MDLKKKLPIHEYTLANGLRVVMISMHKAPIVCFTLAYKVGSKNEVRGKTGIAHLLEHLMFEGSKHVPKGNFDKLCSMAGGTNNAYTSFDLTAYEMTLPSHQLELGLWLESDRMGGFAAIEESLRNQQKVITEEIRQVVDDQPYGKWRELLSSAAFDPRSSYSWEVHGSMDDVVSCSLDDINNFFNKYYQPSNACLVIAGDLNPEKAYPMVDLYFGNIHTNGTPETNGLFLPEYMQGGRHESFTDVVPMSAVFVSYHCPGFLDNNVHEADMISNIAGSGRSSRLYHSLVYEQQIASMAGSYVDKRELASLMIFYAVANDPVTTCDQLYEALQKEIDKIAGSGITDKEYHKSINKLTTHVAYEMQSAFGIADIAANQVLFWNDPERIYSILERYKELSIDDINNFARQTLKPENMIRVDAVPEKESE